MSDVSAEASKEQARLDLGQPQQFNIFTPPQPKGHVELFPNYYVTLLEMPAEDHQRNMEKAFGFKFTTYGEKADADHPTGP